MSCESKVTRCENRGTSL